NFYYQRANPEAKKHAKEFEAANNMFLSRFFGDEKEQYLALIQEMKEGKTVEALVAKISDIIECVHYKKVIHRLSSLDVEANSAYLGKLIDALPEPRAKEVMHRFLEGWKKEIIDDRGAVDIIQMPPSHD
ncbi:MAG: hypothetical protein U1C71_00615, partial [archaeon]|nr:hypothetical protein [archaeon]